MGICKDCEFGVFCPSWGEQKCVMKSEEIKFEVVNCEFYKKSDRVNECKCEACSERRDMFEDF